MGVGFLLGGFCPGTSVAALSIGKVDAMVFVAGLFLGVFVYGEFFPVFEGLFSGRYFDRETIFSLIGLSKGAFVFWLIVVALLAFAVAGYLESTVPEDRWQLNSVKYQGYGLEAVLLLVTAFMVLYLPTPVNSFSEMDDEELFRHAVSNERYVHSDELAFYMVNDVDDFQIIDVRDAISFQRFHLPGAINVQYEELMAPGWESTLDKEVGKTILVSNGGVLADKAWLLSARLGYGNLYVLHGGLNQFVDDIFYSPKPDKDVIRQEIHDQYRFRNRVARLFQQGDDFLKRDNPPSLKKPVVKQTVTVSGGC
jgi:rhodanese-related sulfurtransferase